MIRAYHAISGAYGFWLPNDPRGSWSTKVWARHLRPFGPAAKVNTRKSLAHEPHDRDRRRHAKRHLKYPAVHFHGLQARAVGRGFADAVRQFELAVYACAIMPDHAHLVIGWGRETIEQMVGFLKRAASRQLRAEGRHPLAEFRCSNGRLPSPWIEGGWFVYLETPAQIRQRIGYVEGNPAEVGLPPQRWSFVRPFAPAPRGRGG